MPISANSVFEIRPTASANNINGGFFVTGATGSNFSLQDTAQFNITNLGSQGAGNVVACSAAVASMVGNCVRVIQGTNFTVGGWFEITAVSVGSSITFSTNQADAAISTGVGAGLELNIGGALSLGHASDDAIFDNALNTNAGITFWIKKGTYTLGSAISNNGNGTGLLHHKIRGYNLTRGDHPDVGDHPTLICGASNAVALGNFWDIEHVVMTGTNSYVLTPGSGSKIIHCKVTNASESADRAGIVLGNNNFIFQCDVTSYRGHGISGNVAAQMVYCCYIHDCNVGINNFATGNDSNYVGNLIANCVTAAIRFTNAATELNTIADNTLYGS